MKVSRSSLGSRSNIVTCQRCCNGTDLCNSEGCGATDKLLPLIITKIRFKAISSNLTVLSAISDDGTNVDNARVAVYSILLQCIMFEDNTKTE